MVIGEVDMKVYDIFLDRLPKIDLHGFDRESARVMVNDFVDEAYELGYLEILIIHGIGTGIVKEATHEALSRNKKVLEFHICGENVGCTVVKIKQR